MTTFTRNGKTYTATLTLDGRTVTANGRVTKWVAQELTIEGGAA